MRDPYSFMTGRRSRSLDGAVSVGIPVDPEIPDVLVRGVAVDSADIFHGVDPYCRLCQQFTAGDEEAKEDE